MQKKDSPYNIYAGSTRSEKSTRTKQTEAPPPGHTQSTRACAKTPPQKKAQFLTPSGRRPHNCRRSTQQIGCTKGTADTATPSICCPWCTQTSPAEDTGRHPSDSRVRATRESQL